MPKFEEFTADELKQLGEDPSEQPIDEDLPDDTDDDEPAETKEVVDEPDPDGEDDDEPEQGETKKPDAKVNLGALHEERAERKKYQSMFEDISTRYARLEARTEMILKGLAQPQEEQKEQIPDKATDPIGYMEYMEKRLAALETGKVEETKVSQEQAQINEAMRIGNTMAATVRAKDPETYDSALEFVVSQRAAELRVLGTPDHLIPDQINREMQAGMMTALRRKENPGDFLLKYAAAVGFKKAAKPNDEGKSEVREELTRLSDAQRKNKSLGSGAGSDGISTKSLARQLATMTDDEFAAWYSKPGNKKEFAKAQL